MARHALVTGAAAGIGRAIALDFAAGGIGVALVDIDQVGIETLARDIRNAGGEAVAIAGSVGNFEEVDAIFAKIDATWDTLDLLVNNAGITANCPTLDLRPDQWRRTMAVNLDGTFFCMQQAARRMRGAGGCIVNLTSIYGIVGAPNRAAYCASKAAVAHLTRALAVEWASIGIRVNAVAPGYVETPGTIELMDAGQIDRAALERRTPLARLAKPAEIVAAVRFLTSEDASYVTGQILGVDGGWAAYGYV